VLYPPEVTLASFGRADDADTMRLVEMSADQVKANRALVLQRGNERPILVSVPALEFKEPAKQPGPKAGRITVDADEAAFEGEGLNLVECVRYKEKTLPFTASEDGRTLRVTGLRAAGVTSAAALRELELTFKSAKTKVSLDVVTAKLETVAR